MTQTPPPDQPPIQHPATAAAIAPPAKGKTLALLALIFGICSIIPCLGIVTGITAMVLGIVALVLKTPRKGMAIAGIVVPIFGIALGIALLLPPMTRARELAKRALCAYNLKAVSNEILLYQTEHEDVFPPSLETLIEEGLPEKCMQCPSADEDPEFDYFYLPPSPMAPPDTLIACDYGDNHDNYRNVLFKDGSLVNMNDTEFAEELSKPHNAAFAAALQQAEGP